MRRALKHAVRNAPMVHRVVARAQRSAGLQNSDLYRMLRRRWIDHRRGQLRLPDLIDVEVTTRCNANCIMCPHDRSTREPTSMSAAVFETIVRRAVEAPVSRINLNHLGEPLLDPGLPDKIELATANGLWVQLNTNAAELTREMAGGLLRAGVDHIAISFSGGSRETYEAVHRGLSFDRTLHNIDQLLALRERVGRAFVSVTFVRQPTNAHETAAFRRLFRDRVDDVVVRDVRDWAGAVPVAARFRGRETSPDLPRFPCKLLWSRMVVLVDGRVALCEVDWEGRHVLGDLETQSIREIWSGSAIERMRRAHLDDICERIDPCRDCHIRESWW